MAFENLSERLGKAFKNITGKGKLTEKNMNDMLREVRMSLLEADVNYGVVKDFISRIKEKAMGQEVLTSLNPGQMVVKIVHDEIVALLGTEDAPVNYKKSGITTIMMVGLQGTGKTTASAKIANLMKKKQGRNPLLVACDVIRPAAIDQLKTLGESIGVEVFSLGVETKALETAKQAMVYAKENGYDTVLFDTAGRLHIDDELMQELSDIKAYVQPDDILLTVDAMTGQDIVNVASSFHEQLEVSGLVLTKLDGDSRGGGILSVRAITNVPVKFVGLGEKIEDLDVFHPDRMADRILGMGDIMSLVEKAQEKMDMEATTKSTNRMMSGEFTLTDMLVQYEQIEKMGSLGGMMKLLPGMGQLAGQIDEAKADNKIKKSKAIIQSMTPEERENPNILRASRKNRIAKGSGVSVADVNRCLNEFEKMKQVMKQFSSLAKGGKMPNLGGLGAMKNMRAMSRAMGGKKGRKF
ncbi:signal recognition particle protein [Amedibacterium intestinale]|uniref:Signal recognition particle protein n=1 Tax=Amedibacterium intestinale TaxID=2583452 RepID=A0A6N4TFX1_9FIRM|nr:signal recognition particle protein [Amedibacterium intestinale]RHO23253.1 signal recognition particle protein [Eubacterium sp. AM18-26]RHO27612.1 signal recognition particle protein [Eubacterium sp. AM18-10LB-B]RHO29571.1 signal recognition particle protein [Erysipelotrichaceae bacterium AM17-60]BBK21808.1 signal recognition particle protein [Amedibacterium intestinale]BBK61955.1 signal recognition particle protein [Amedibacterium intestinale]